MLNPFPQLLTYAFFAPTFLRVVAAIIFFIIAARLVIRHKEIEETTLPIIGKPKTWLVGVSASIIAVISVALLVGFATQWVAILGAVAALKHAMFRRRYPSIIPFPRSTNILLLLICLSLLLTGAGALAFDLPL